MNEQQMLAVAQSIAARHGLAVEILPDIRSVGVGGDARTYTPVVCLTGPWPGHQVLASVSTEISNGTGLNRVIYELARR